jgi:hypothetical protein
MRLPSNATRKLNRDLTKFNLSGTDENNTAFSNVALQRRPTTRPLAAAEAPFITLPKNMSVKNHLSIANDLPSSPESGNDDDKESYCRHFAAQKHQLRVHQQQALAGAATTAIAPCSQQHGQGPQGAKIGIVRPRQQHASESESCCASGNGNVMAATATGTRSSGVQTLLSMAMAHPRTQEVTPTTVAVAPVLPPRHVTITIQRHAPTSAVTISAVANILRQCLKDLKNMDKQKHATQAVQTYEQTADRFLHCLRLQCLSSTHTKLAALSIDRCCKQWLMALKNISPSLKAEEINRQRAKAQLCRKEAQAILRSVL